MTTGGLREFVADTAAGEDSSLAAVRQRAVRGVHGAAGTRRGRKRHAPPDLAGHLRLAAVQGRPDAPVRAGQTGRPAGAEPGRRHPAGRTAGDPLAETPRPGRGPASRPGPGPDPGADQPACAAAHRQGGQHGQRHPAAQRRRQDRGPAGRGPRHGHRAHRETQRAAPPPSSRRGWPWPRSAATPARRSKAAGLLAGVPGVAHASQSVFIAALTALGRHPADYTSGVDAEITATMPAPVAVARLLLRLLDTMEQNVDGVLRDIDTEFLHDLRVAVRRTRSAIKLLGRVLPADLAEHFKAEFKWLGDVTTPVRDLDVHLLGFDALTETAGRRVPGRPGAAARLPGQAAGPRVPAAGRGAARTAVPRHHRRLAQGPARDPRRRRPPAAASHRGRAGPVRDRPLVPADRRAGRRDHLGLAPGIPA